jgi:exonuclease SbcC
MITKVRIKNWRSHLDTELSFSEGTNCFIGTMGAGKTSILDAICFALFGTFPALNSKKVKLEDMIMRKPKQAKSAEVTVWFALDDTEWSVRRVVEKGKTVAELRKGSQLIEAPQPTRVSEEVERLLRIDYDLFTRAIYSEQNALDMFLTIPKGQRMKKIDELLAIDRFEHARFTVMALVRRFADVISERRNMLAGLQGELSPELLDRLKAELTAAQSERTKMEQQLSTARQDRASAEKRLLQLRQQAETVHQMQEEITTIMALTSAAQTDIDQLADELTKDVDTPDGELQMNLAKIEENLTLLKDNAAVETEKLDKLRTALADNTAQLKFLEETRIPEMKGASAEHDKLLKQLAKRGPKKIQATIEAKRDSIEEMSARLERASGRIEELNESIPELTAAKAHCPVCEAKLTEADKEKILDKKQKNIAKFTAEREKLGPAIEMAKEEVEKLEEELHEAHLLEERASALEEAGGKVKEALAMVKRLKSEVINLDNEQRLQAKTLTMLEMAKERARSEAEKYRTLLTKRQLVTAKVRQIKDNEQRIAALKATLTSAPSPSPASISEADRAVNNSASLEGGLEARLAAAGQLLEERSARFAEMEAKRGKVENYRREIGRLEGITDQLRLLEGALVNTQEQLRKNFVAAVNQAMTMLWDSLYPYKDFSSVRLGIQEGDYVLQLLDSTGWIPADGVASGGERSIACLALRMAFALVLAPQLRWLVLDEPTHNLDQKAVEDLAIVLRDKIGEFVEQVFLITHDPSLESAVTGYLYRLEREKEKDGCSKAVLVAGPEN